MSGTFFTALLNNILCSILIGMHFIFFIVVAPVVKTELPIHQVPVLENQNQSLRIQKFAFKTHS